MPNLDAIYRQAAELAVSEGIGPDDRPFGAVHQWVQRNVSYRPGTEFFIVLGISCAIADIQAEAQGYASAADRAASLAWKV